MANLSLMKRCRSVKYVWKTSKQTFLTISNNFEGVSSVKGAQNSSKYVKNRYFRYIGKNSDFWRILSYFGPFSTRNRPKVVGNCQKCLFWCFLNIFDKKFRKNLKISNKTGKYPKKGVQVGGFSGRVNY